MALENLTLADLAKLTTTLMGAASAAPMAQAHAPRPVVVCTDKRGVVFGYTTDINARPIILRDARMCLYWSADVGGVFGLGERGPSAQSKISATLGEITLEGVTAIFAVTPAAEAAWKSAKVQGR